MRLLEDKGQTLVLTAFLFPVLLGFIGLAVDSGVLFRAKRKLQTAADAAAVAGALDYLYNDSQSSAQAVASAASSDNGFTDGSEGAVVTVNAPASNGANSGLAGSVEVIVRKPVHTFFMGIFGHSSFTLAARAVAGTPTPGNTCVWAMKTSGTGLDLQGAYDIEAPNCGIYVNSDTSDAISVTGGGGTVNAAFLNVVGNSTPKHQTNPTAVTTGAPVRSSPWGYLTGPTPTNGGCTTVDSSTKTISGTVTGPGLGYAVCYTNAVTLSGATLGPGTYMFENGLTVSGTVSVNGGTLDIYSGTFSQGNATLNVTAPTSGTYNGIAIMQAPSNTNQLQVQFGSSNQTLDGYIYAPGAEVYLQDHGGGIVATGIVASWIYDKASTIRIPSYDKKHPHTTKNRVVTLLE